MIKIASNQASNNIKIEALDSQQLPESPEFAPFSSIFEQFLEILLLDLSFPCSSAKFPELFLHQHHHNQFANVVVDSDDNNHNRETSQEFQL